MQASRVAFSVTNRAQQRIGLAIKLANTDLSKATEKDLEELRKDLNEILGQPRDLKSGGRITLTNNMFFFPLSDPSPHNFSTDDFRSLQQEIRSLLRNFTDQSPTQSAHGIDIKAHYTLTNAAGLALLPGTALVHVLGSGRDLALLALFMLFSVGSVPYVRSCPECQTVFVRVRRQKYCSRRCVNKANFRAWKTTNEEKARAAARETASKRYAQAVRRKLGNKVRVASRPRRASAREEVN